MTDHLLDARRPWRRRGVLAAAAAFSLGLIAGAALAQDIPETKLILADFGPPQSVGGIALQEYMKAVTEASGGRITFDFFPSAAVLAPAEQAAGIAAGTADMGQVLTPYNPADFPVSNWVAEMGTLPKGGVPFSQLYGSMAQTEFVRTNPDYLAEMNGQGLHVIGAAFTQAFDMLCNKPVKTLADAQGKRIRVGGKVWANEVQAIGMTPVPLVPTEIYEAFQRGIVDCLSIHPNVYLDYGLLDVPGTKYYVPVEFSGWNTAVLAINKAKWDAFPQSVRDVLNGAFPVFLEKQLEGNYARHTTFAALTDKNDVELIQPADDLVKALADYHAKALDGLAATAPPTVKDPAKLIADFKALQDKWKGLVEQAGYKPAPADIGERMKSYATPLDLKPFDAIIRAELARMP